MVYNVHDSDYSSIYTNKTKEMKKKKKKRTTYEEKKETKTHPNRNINFKERLQSVMFVDVNTSLV